MSGWDDPTLSRTGEPLEATEGTGDILGRGGEALVFAGRDRRLPREVAWKVVAPGDARGAERLTNEARMLSRLEHPSIVPLYDIVRGEDGSMRLALRQIRGETFASAIQAASQSSLDLQRRLRLLPNLLSAAHAVAWAHHEGVLHRDVKSSNVMIGAFGETQLLDWGLAIDLGDARSGELVGTPTTMSPEQARGEAADARSDVWGLGTLLCEVITGRALFAPTERDPERIIDQLRRGLRPRLDPPRECPRALIAIAERALAPAAEDRYPDAAAFAADLAAFIEGRVVAAHRYSAFELFTRFTKTFRVPIAIAVTLLFTAALGAFVAYRGISGERDMAIQARDAANRALVSAGLANARRELDDDFRVEAEQALAQVLEHADHPEARGILAAFARSPRLSWLSTRPAPEPCPMSDVSPSGRVLCGDGEQVTYTAGDTMRRLSQAHRSARFLGEDLVVSAADGLLVVTPEGRQTRLTGCGGALTVYHGSVRGTVEGALVDLSDRCMTLLRALPEGPRSERFRPCGELPPQSATPTREGFVALCPDGSLVEHRHHPHAPSGSTPIEGGPLPPTRVTQTGLRSQIGVYRTMAPVEPGRLLVGTANGELLLVDLETGRTRARQTVRPTRLIRSVSTRDQLGLIHIDGSSPLLIHLESLAPLTRLPRSDPKAWFVGGDIASHSPAREGGRINRWRLAPGALDVHVQEGRPGITSATFEDTRTLRLTHTEVAEVADASTGRTLALARFPGLQGGVAKGIGLDGPGGLVAMTSDDVPLLPPSGDGSELLAIGSYRRIVTIAPSGKDAPARFAIAATGRGLFVLEGGDRFLLHPETHLDLRSHGRLLAGLGSEPRVARLWDLGASPAPLSECRVAGSAIALLPPHGELGPEPHLVTVDMSGLSVLDPDCALVRRFESTGEPTLAAVTSSRPTLFAAGTREGRLDVFDSNGRLRATLSAHSYAVRALDFSPDDRTLVSGAWDGRLRFLDVAPIHASREALVSALSRVGTPIR